MLTTVSSVNRSCSQQFLRSTDHAHNSFSGQQITLTTVFVNLIVYTNRVFKLYFPESIITNISQYMFYHNFHFHIDFPSCRTKERGMNGNRRMMLHTSLLRASWRTMGILVCSLLLSIRSSFAVDPVTFKPSGESLFYPISVSTFESCSNKITYASVMFFIIAIKPQNSSCQYDTSWLKW